MSPEAREHSFDELARGLASGSLSRRKALRLMGGLLLASALGSLPGVAWANDDDDDRCPQGQTRCKERCVNLRFNERHCGRCFNRCRSTQSCCNGRCVNLDRNENHCGECFHRCEEGQECAEGMCSGGEPICNPPCPFPCACFDRADGTGTVCGDCSTTSCPGASSCAECTAAGRICTGGPVEFVCVNPSCPPCVSNGGSCFEDAHCCSLLCVNNVCGV
jgi:hypothetical protein